MRWMWVDRILELVPGERASAIKNVSMAEEYLHDHFPAHGDMAADPVMPMSLIVEGMAQTAGILVGRTREFREKVILAKVSNAELTVDARPGDQLRYGATLLQIGDQGASTSGIVEIRHAGSDAFVPAGRIDLMFSHIDNNSSGLAFPEHNFVFSDAFHELLNRSGYGFTTT